MDAPAVSLPPDWPERWRSAHAQIDQAGYGETVAAAYRDCGPKVAALVGAEPALRLGRVVSEVAIRCSRRAAEALCRSTVTAARTLTGAAETLRWLETVQGAVKAAPKSAGFLLDNTDRLLKTLDLEGFQTFVRMGIAIGRSDIERQAAFFRLEDPEARQYLDHTAEPNGFHAFEGRLKPFLSALWGIGPPMREGPSQEGALARRRAGFGSGSIRLPSAFSGLDAEESLRTYQAAVAHIGAHHRYTRGLFPVGKLKPLQLAVISLIEDARVERLAMRQMPGLARLWLPFHVARAGGPPMALSLMARLSRALIDPGYSDSDGWVEKGRTLFEEAALLDLHDQSFSRRIGGLLGNDLGQMRLQFDAKTYVVQPAYRDDNLGIWDFGEDSADMAMMEEITTGARIEQQQGDDGKSDEADASPDPDQRVSRASIATSEDTIETLAHYHEFDYVVGRNRPKWCTLRAADARLDDSEPIRRFEERHSGIADRLSSLIRSSRIGRAERIRRQPEGELLDVDACIESSVSQRAGETPDFRVYGRLERRTRDLAVLVLLDVSQSTAERVKGKTETVLDLERFSTALLAKALSETGDPFAIAGFCSDTREDVRYVRIKNFDGAYDNVARSRLAGLRSGLSTRLGTAIRHAGADLARRQTHRRLLLLVTDGEPSDIDVDDGRYLVEDARAAVHSLNREGIDTFCVALQSGSVSYADRIFGRKGTAVIASVEQLPVQLPTIFYRLTR